MSKYFAHRGCEIDGTVREVRHTDCDSFIAQSSLQQTSRIFLVRLSFSRRRLATLLPIPKVTRTIVHVLSSCAISYYAELPDLCSGTLAALRPVPAAGAAARAEQCVCGQSCR